MCPLPTAITSRVPAREGGLTLPTPRGTYDQSEHEQWPGQGCWGPRATSQVTKPKCKANLRHLDKVQTRLGEARRRF